MNWQPLTTQPFDPKNYRLPTIERRRRLMGKPVRETVRSDPPPCVGVQQDHHVRAWERWKLTMPIGRLSRHVFKRCVELGANYNDIVGPTRHRNLIPIRHLLMWELRNLLNPSPSLPEIAAVFGKRDHTGVWYAIDKVETRKREGKL
ncbi:helix-turn-helix domain-containing protein [Shinella zoogloeoides]